MTVDTEWNACLHVHRRLPLLNLSVVWGVGWAPICTTQTTSARNEMQRCTWTTQGEAIPYIIIIGEWSYPTSSADSNQLLSSRIYVAPLCARHKRCIQSCTYALHMHKFILVACLRTYTFRKVSIMHLMYVCWDVVAHWKIFRRLLSEGSWVRILLQPPLKDLGQVLHS